MEGLSACDSDKTATYKLSTNNLKKFGHTDVAKLVNDTVNMYYRISNDI